MIPIFHYKTNTYYYGILPRRICFVYRVILGKILNQNSINFSVWPLLIIVMVQNLCRIMKGRNWACFVICLTCTEKVLHYIKLRSSREVPWMRQLIMFLGPFHPTCYCVPVQPFWPVSREMWSPLPTFLLAEVQDPKWYMVKVELVTYTHWMHNINYFFQVVQYISFWHTSVSFALSLLFKKKGGGRQCMYNVTLRNIYATIVTMEKQ